LTGCDQTVTAFLKKYFALQNDIKQLCRIVQRNFRQKYTASVPIFKKKSNSSSSIADNSDRSAVTTFGKKLA